MGTDCQQCHSQSAWHDIRGFDHDLGGFPLTGMHATVSCGECHENNRFHDASDECVACHSNDDPHAGTLGNNCGSCHNSNDWRLTAFDHDLHTTFPLDGKHAALQCGDCHSDSSATANDTPSTCGGCHLADDVHSGQFGARCDQCHSTSSFSGVESLTGQRP